MAFGIILEYSKRNISQDRRLPRPGRSNNEAPLPLSNWTEDVHHAYGHLSIRRLEAQPFVGGDGRELGEFEAFLALIDLQSIDRVDISDFRIGKAITSVGFAHNPASPLNLESPHKLPGKIRIGASTLAIAIRVEQLARFLLIRLVYAFYLDAWV